MSQYIGVTKDITNNFKKWRASIRIDGRAFFIGNFNTEIEAAKAYDKKCLELRKDFARLNFPLKEKKLLTK